MTKLDENPSKRTDTAQHIFVSYAHEDLKWAEWVSSTLEANGSSVTLARWDFHPGNNFVIEMHDALKKCDRVIALLSPAYLFSQYSQAEWAAAFTQDPTGKKGHLIPVRIEDCVLTGLLLPIVYADLVGLDKGNATQVLLASVSGDRLKPELPAQFPGPEHQEERGGIVEPEVQYARSDYPETEEEGLVDFVLRGTDSMRSGTEAAERFAEQIRLVGERVIERAGQFDQLKRHRQASVREYKMVAQATARDMRQFVDEGQPELQTMAIGWEVGLAAWHRAIELLPAFGDVDEILVNNLSSIDSMIAALPRARESTEQMLISTRHLQPVEGSFIVARNRVAGVLEAAIRVLDRTGELAEAIRDSVTAALAN